MAEQGTKSPVLYRLELRGFTLEAREVRGVEQYSAPFRFEVWSRLVDEYALLDPERLVGDGAMIYLSRDGEYLRRVRGIITHASVEATVNGEPELYAVVEPRLVRTRYRKDSRVFREMTVPQIVTSVLETASVPVVSRLTGDYRVRAYTVQWQETDLDFISRLMEEEGISYTFLDDPLGWEEQDVAVLVLLDDGEQYPDIPGEVAVPFAPGKSLEREVEVIYELGQRSKLAPRAVTYRDFHIDRPSLDMTVSAEGPTSAGAEYYDFPGNYAVPDDGKRLAAIAARALACDANKLAGATDCGRLIPGHRFRLVDAPAGTGDGDHVVLRVAHDFERAERPFSAEIEVLAATPVFRPLRRAPRPRIAGTLTGFATGPEGVDIHTNELGQAKVWFPWDRKYTREPECSRWVSVLQDNTGESAGIARVGWELIVAFVEGDPDRPIVLGRVYNGADPFPEPLPLGKTRTTLKSLTSPPDGAPRGPAGTFAPSGVAFGPSAGVTTVPANEIFMEDATGKELIYLQAQKDQNIVIAHDKKQNVLNNETNQVDGDETVEVGNDETVVVGVDSSLNARSNQVLTVGGNRSRKVGAADTASIVGNRAVTIGGNHMRRIGTYDHVSAKGDLKEQVGAIDLEASLKPNTINAGMVETLTVGGALIELAVGRKAESVDTIRAETIGGLLVTHTFDTFNTSATVSRSTSVGGTLSVEAKQHVLYESATKVDVTSAATFTAEGATAVAAVVGASTVKLTGGAVSFQTTTLSISAGTIELYNAEVQQNPG